MWTVYGYGKCSTCRNAVKWLEERNVPFGYKAIRETPPSPEELRTALAMLGGDVRKLFNTSGNDYRDLGMKEKLPGLSMEEAIGLLAGNGNLVKRPFVLGPGVALVGFKPEAWSAALKSA